MRRAMSAARVAGAAVALAAGVSIGVAMPVAAQSDPSTIDLSEVDWSAVTSEAEGFPGVALFDMPRVMQQTRLVTELARERQPAAAMRVLDQLMRRYPYVADFHATRALLLAQQGELEAAFTALDRALDLGYTQIGAIRRAKGWAALTATMPFRELAARPRTPPVFTVPSRRPSRIEGQTAPVSAQNSAWSPADRAVRPAFVVPETLSRRAPLGRDGQGVARDLAARIERGEAAGLAGILYDNRDRDHSTLQRERFPRLAFVEYNEAARARDLDYGISRGLLFEAPTIGNSSTALTAGAFWRSQPRRALTEPGGGDWLAQLYENNHLYVYPEHRDHDPQADGGRGDLFPANTPLLLISQGSSGSDRPILRALMHILAALSPETRASIEARRLIAPTLQMVFRRGMSGIDDDGERYMSGAAHPTVFDGDGIDLERLIAIASRLTPATVPPVVSMTLRREWDATPGQDFFGDGLSETLFTTPYAIARIWRSTATTRRLSLTASADGALEPERVSYEWRLLRGDPAKVRLRPGGAHGERVSVEIDWHGETTAARARPSMPEITSHRVDIAVFARYGDELSAPAILSIAFPPRQRRDVDPASGRVLSIHHHRDDDPERYADPLLFPVRDWVDAFGYDAGGAITGWTRRYPDGRDDQLFTAQGFLVLQSEVSGRPVLVESVTYPAKRTASGPARVDMRRSGERFRIIYADDEARRGVLVRDLPEGASGGDQ